MPNQSHLDSINHPSVRLGISSCLLGEKVRFNGGHMKDSFLLDTLGRYVEWVPVCPEVEIGMGIPRENIRLIGDPQSPRLAAPKSGTDYTDTMKQWAGMRVNQPDFMGIHGYILKSNSPSCGLFRVRVYANPTAPSRNGQGMFAQKLVVTFPLLPVEEEGRLHDAKIRENFVERIFVYQRWQQLLDDNPTRSKLVFFHTSHKSTLMAHDPRSQAELGRLVANQKHRSIAAVISEYGMLLMNTTKIVATNRKHANVLLHLLGFLKTHLDYADKEELLELITEYRLGYIPLVVPLTLLQHHLHRNPVPDWVKQQVYLNPYPKELSLRNHV